MQMKRTTSSTLRWVCQCGKVHETPDCPDHEKVQANK